ncbi:rhodanese-like domain-containing protein [Sulfurovum sp.]|jgi:rhodanese-related sulfurtransferase|uniref:rhodanese-like domain-containing protein n=1 Tax=Sulfurovum sp. TaxID=1969726 RepID=UPI002A369132|nr:rhodanese-like domain-containing protein [Sulfurovum sp.]MDD2451765.1 rhodanese-like domain-containing protein [Sulfurovum sp.]MDD3498984.1 rhodanese-like domain-containing protein [Sulfurovum sp.]MDY0402536.1 rhodanese-like domain-containing protein [Sulfurovum sp.]
MLKQYVISALAVALFALNASAYDTKKAENLDAFYSHMTQKACADSKLFTTGEEVMKMFKEKAKFTLLDVRTAGENAVVSVSSQNAMHIPVKNLFEKANLDRLPTDQPIIIVCHSGTRATIVAMGLQQIGFGKVHVLKGGLVALAEANNPKNAPIK